MNAQPHAIATAPAHALADASSAGSVDAKRREGTAQDRTTPNGVFSSWSPSTTSSRNVGANRSAWRAPLVDRFFDNVETSPDGCWLWMGGLTARGYARFSVNRKLTMVHRFAYEMVNGEVGEGLEIGHLCHVRRCVNPNHLRAMTHAENVQMSVERRGRSRAMTNRERGQKWRAKRAQELRESRRLAELESGWWVSI